MARPIKKNADYFTHDKDMRDDPRIKALRRTHGLVGYAVYCMMLETLTDSEEFKHPWGILEVELLAGDFGLNPAELDKIIGYCTDTLKLFVVEDGFIRCPKLEERFSPLITKRERQRNWVIDSDNTPRKGLSTSKIQNNGVIDVESTQSIVEYSRVKKSKEERDINSPRIIPSKERTIDSSNISRGQVSKKPQKEDKGKENPYDENISEVVNKFVPYFNELFNCTLSADNISSIKNGILYYKDKIEAEYATIRIFLRTLLMRMSDKYQSPEGIKEPIGFFIAGAFGREKYLWSLTVQEETSTMTGYHKQMIAKLDKNSPTAALLS